MGHKSIACALKEQFGHLADAGEDVVVMDVDAFSFNKNGVRLSQLYNTVTRKAPRLWDLSYHATDKIFPISKAMAKLIDNMLLECVNTFKPDVIFSVHSMFIGSVIDALHKHGLDIPVVSLVADIVDPHSTWFDKRQDMVLCPTMDVYESAIMHGLPPEKLRYVGFPVREAFCEAARAGAVADYVPGSELRCLLMGGGGGAGHISDYAAALLEIPHIHLNIVCGHNEELASHLSETLGATYGERLRVLGPVEDMVSEFKRVDIAVLRASPNCIMESSMMGVPIVMTGALPGQEAGNPDFVLRHNLGVLCEGPSAVGFCIDSLLENDAQKLRSIQKSQVKFRDPDAAARAVREVLSFKRA